MNIEDFSKTLAARLNISPTAARAVVDTMAEIIVDSVATDDVVRIPNFGKFYKATIRTEGKEHHRLAFRAFEHPNERIKNTMEKYGVEIDKEKVKTAGAKKVCPECGAELSFITTPPTCPNCGTKPFEKDAKGGK
jgi:hypothetical protein